MSAFQVAPDHIRAMLQAMVVYGSNYGDPCWYHAGETKRLTPDTIEDVGWMLWRENARSLHARYEDPSDMVPDLGTDFRWTDDQTELPNPVETLKQIDCYRYQASETEDWSETEAAAFCSALQSAAINRLPGYAEAPWGWDMREAKA